MALAFKNFHYVILFFLPICSSQSYADSYYEDLLIKPLATGEVYTQFKFVVETETHPTSFKHFRLFPRLLGEIISKNSVQELHFSLTQGLWRYEKWGYPFRAAPPGAEVWAWFKKSTPNVKNSWGNLVDALSGQFCSSLNFIDEKISIEPQYSFRPQGAVLSSHNSSFARYATLPAEIVCTENLTPFKKLLPCGTKAGLSTLLNAINLFNSHYVSLAIDFRTVCKSADCSKTALELVQSVSVVFDPPVEQQGKQDWSLVKLFGIGLFSTCPVASKSMAYVDVSLNKTGIQFFLKPTPTSYTSQRVGEGKIQVAVYDLKTETSKSKPFNFGATYKSPHIYWIVPPPILYAHRHVTGYGQERSGIRSVIHNTHPTKSLQILYMDVIPWYLRLYLHTVKIKMGKNIVKPDHLYFKPGKDRVRPSHIELLLTVPAHSKVEINMDFEYVFLKWTEYPPDANHGFSVGPAVISTLLPTNRNFTVFPGQTSVPQAGGKHFLRIHTEVLLVSLPTPDFSMPYNVICLSCTVVALAFGPIHNITTKSLRPIPDDEVGLIRKAKKYLIHKLWKKDAKETAAAEGTKEDETKKTR